MSPEQLQEFNKMKATLEALKGVLDVPFIENAKRRIATPAIIDVGLGEVIVKNSVGGTSGVLRSVDEAGSGTYDVAYPYDGTIIVSDTDGNTYKLGYYTP